MNEFIRKILGLPSWREVRNLQNDVAILQDEVKRLLEKTGVDSYSTFRRKNCEIAARHIYQQQWAEMQRIYGGPHE